VAADGSLISKETDDEDGGKNATTEEQEDEVQVSLEQVPALVKETILAEAQGGTIAEIELESENGQAVYEAEVVVDGQEIELTIAADGKLV
jgi:uncharacterized membrane protein YkoI